MRSAGAKVASLSRQPLLAEPGAVQLPRYVFTWLTGESGRNGDWSLPDIALLFLLLAKWFEVEQTVGELRIRLGDRARTLSR